jgi:hypothetical protein
MSSKMTFAIASTFAYQKIGVADETLAELPDGRIVRKHTSKVDAPEAAATALVYKGGRAGAIVWPGERPGSVSSGAFWR